jgi:ankyrin repeat protein
MLKADQMLSSIGSSLFIILRKEDKSEQKKLEEVVELLKKNPRPNINEKDGNNGNTPLHMSVSRDYSKIVNFLLTQEADITVENNEGKTPLILARELNKPEIITLLENHVAQSNQSVRKIKQTYYKELAQSPSEQQKATNSQPKSSSNSNLRYISPPFSVKLPVDTKLKLSRKNFMHSLKELEKRKRLSTTAQLNKVFPYPTPYVFAQFASMAYEDDDALQNAKKKLDILSKIKNKLNDNESWNKLRKLNKALHDELKNFDKNKLPEKLQKELNETNDKLKALKGWQLLTTASNKDSTNGYFGAAYWHPKSQQVVIAHRGTDPKNLGAVWADIKGVIFKNYVPQMNSASTFADDIRLVLDELNKQSGVNFQLFFTGHSLGGWLAQITTFTTEYLHKEDTCFQKNVKDKDEGYHAHTVVFESPGCEDMLSKMQKSFDVHNSNWCSTPLEDLDITSYLSAPNRINTYGFHLGTFYRLFTDLSDKEKNDDSWVKWAVDKFKEKTIDKITKHTLITHSMDRIKEVFDPETGQAYRDKIQEAIDWPISIGLRRGKAYKKFFFFAKFPNNYHPDEWNEAFRKEIKKIPGYNHIRYQTKPFDERSSNLNVFTQAEQQFLKSYHVLREFPKFFKPVELFSALGDASSQTQQQLQHFDLVLDDNDKVRLHCKRVNCKSKTVYETLHWFIPYVKVLLRSFPQLQQSTAQALSFIEIKKQVYRSETEIYLQKIRQEHLDVQCDVVGIEDFLKDPQQQVWQLVVDKNTRIGLTKLYRSWQKTAGDTKYREQGGYTILKLRQLLTTHQHKVSLINFLNSPEMTHYLLIVECNTDEVLNSEVAKQLFNGLLNILNNKPAIKVIFVTKSSSDDLTESFRQKAETALNNRFRTTKDASLTWGDLTADAQRKLLAKNVDFQRHWVALNQLIDAESSEVADLVLPDLLEEERPIEIGKPLSISDCYYIDRTFNHQIAIKKNIEADQAEQRFSDLLAYSEQEFKQLCQQNPTENIHWLQCESSGQFSWQQSQGSLEKLREYIDNHHPPHSYPPKDLNDFLQQAQRQKVMLISDIAGTGKTTVLTHLSKQLKQKFPTHWVVRIDLNGHMDALKEYKENFTSDSAIKFLSENLKLEKPLEKALFKQCFEQKGKIKFVLMLDGFDEISPHYKDTVIDLLQALRKTSVEQLWVTTRPHIKGELEDKLQQLSYTLEPFSKANQIEFLTKIWSQKLAFQEAHQEQLVIYAKELINKLTKSISDKEKELTGIPLQTRMLAEAFEEELKKTTPDFPDKLNLLELYQKFLKTKYAIFLKKGPIAEEQQNAIILNDISINKNHQRLALQVLFTEEQINLLQPEALELSNEQSARIGIVQYIDNKPPHFIHRTFAEYFAADFLVSQLQKQKQRKEAQDFLLTQILLQEDYQVIRAFLNSWIKKDKLLNNTGMLTEYGKRIDKLWKQNNSLKNKNYETILHQSVQEGNTQIVSFLLGNLKNGRYTTTLKNLLLTTDYRLGTAWHLAASQGHEKILEKLWAWGKEAQLSPEELKGKLLLAKNREGETAWHLAAEEGHEKILEKLWAWGKEAQLSPEELEDKLLLAKNFWENTAWHRAAKGGHKKISQKLWAWGKEAQLSLKELKEKLLLATDKYGQTVWHLAAEGGHEKILEKLWAWGEEAQLSPEELKDKLLLATDKYGQTAWHLAAEEGHEKILEKLWAWGKEAQLSPEEFKDKLLLGKKNEEQTAWHLAAERGHEKILEKLWEWGKEAQLSPEELKDKLLLTKDFWGKAAWHQAAKKGHEKILEKLWAWGKEAQLSPEQFKGELLLAKNKEGKTTWHRAAKGGHVGLLEKLWVWGKEAQLIPEELKDKLLLATDKYGQTAWHLAAEEGHEKILEKLWAWGKEAQLSPEEFKGKLLLAKNREGETAWQLSAERGYENILEKLWAWGKEAQLIPEELKEKLLLANDKYGQTAWHLAAEEGHEKILKKLWAWGKEAQLSPEELKDKLLLAKDFWGKTAWHRAAKGGYENILEKLRVWGKEAQLSPEETKQELLLAKDKDGQTAWHLVASQGHEKILEKLWAWGKEAQLSPEEFKGELLLAKDKDGKTVWHRAAWRGDVEVFEKLWAWDKEAQLSLEALKDELLLAKDKDGQTACHRAAERGHEKILEKLWAWGKEAQLNSEELKDKLLLATDKYGQTAWHLAAKGGHEKVLEKLWAWGKETISPEELKDELLLLKDKYGKTAWHLAADRGHQKILEKLWTWGKEVQLSPEALKDELLLAKDKDGQTAWHRAAERGHEKILEKLWAWGKEAQLNSEELKDKLLLATDKYGQTAWHLAAKGGHEKVLEKLWAWCKETISPEELKDELLLLKDKYGKTAWHLAADRGHQKILEKLWTWGKEVQLSPEALKDELLLAKDKDGQTAWHRAAEKGRVETLKKLWAWGKEAQLTPEELKQKLLLAKDKDGQTAWHLAAEGGRVGTLEKLWAWGKEAQLSPEELKDKLLLATNEYEQTAWHLAAEGDRVEALEKLWAWSKATLSIKELETVISARNKNGKTALELIQQSKYIREQKNQNNLQI